MKFFAPAVALISLCLISPVSAATPASGLLPDQVIHHGGGCRKSSPRGQCCHMNRSTGQVHCH